MSKFMKEAIKKADYTSNLNIGGPFGACIVKDGEIVCVTSNTVLFDNDPTAHAEMNAIRQAGKILGTYDLSGCELYATGYPCPMCLSAIMWANIDKVYYGCNTTDTEIIGFRDKAFEESIPARKEAMCVELDRARCLELYEAYARLSDKIIY